MGPCIGLERLHGEGDLVNVNHLIKCVGERPGPLFFENLKLALVICHQLHLGGLPVAVACPDLLESNAAALVLRSQRRDSPIRRWILLVHHYASLFETQMSQLAKRRLADL